MHRGRNSPNRGRNVAAALIRFRVDVGRVGDKILMTKDVLLLSFVIARTPVMQIAKYPLYRIGFQAVGRQIHKLKGSPTPSDSNP
jgi:hypothetical protein